jgi:hypothetical protein
MKKFSIVGLILALTFMMSLPVMAAVNYTCSVSYTGPFGTFTDVGLTDTNATPAWTGVRNFRLYSTRAKEQLAVMLSAIGSGKNVLVGLDSILENSVISKAYLLNN